MAKGDKVYKEQLDKWYSKLNTFRNDLGLNPVSHQVSIGDTIFSYHINTLIDNIDTTYFSSYRILNFSTKPITKKVSTGNVIEWLTADQIDFTLNHLSVCADFSNFSTCSNFSDFGVCSNFNPVYCATCEFWTPNSIDSFNLNFSGNVGNTNFSTSFCSRFRFI